jgi:hypothetical protein
VLVRATDRYAHRLPVASYVAGGCCSLPHNSEWGGSHVHQDVVPVIFPSLCLHICLAYLAAPHLTQACNGTLHCLVRQLPLLGRGGVLTPTISWYCDRATSQGLVTDDWRAGARLGHWLLLLCNTHPHVLLWGTCAMCCCARHCMCCRARHCMYCCEGSPCAAVERAHVLGPGFPQALEHPTATPTPPLCILALLVGCVWMVGG